MLVASEKALSQRQWVVRNRLIILAPGLADLVKTNDKRSGHCCIALDSFAQVDCVDCVE
jgi:hypothetical protein